MKGLIPFLLLFLFNLASCDFGVMQNNQYLVPQGKYQENCLQNTVCEIVWSQQLEENTSPKGALPNITFPRSSIEQHNIVLRATKKITGSGGLNDLPHTAIMPLSARLPTETVDNNNLKLNSCWTGSNMNVLYFSLEYKLHYTHFSKTSTMSVATAAEVIFQLHLWYINDRLKTCVIVYEKVLMCLEEC